MIQDTRILANEPVGGDLWLLRLRTETDCSAAVAGAFLHVRVDPGPYPLFRRAYSILRATPDEVELLYKVVGAGTRLLSRRRPGESLSVMGPLGNGFTPPAAGEQALLVAGGVGLPPILRWAEGLLARDVPADAITFMYGARTAAELVLRDRVERLGVAVHYSTDDGSTGYAGRVTDLLAREYASARRARFYACGPGAMLAACTRLAREGDLTGELALETPMPCGSGVCLGCVVPCRDAATDAIVYRRTCIDGPIFDAREVVWPST